MFNIPKLKIPFFAKWARITKPFEVEKHHIGGDKSIIFDVKKGESYSNHIEMAGFYCSSIVSYGCDHKAKLRLMRHIIFPMLRKYPNITRGSLDYNFNGATLKVNKSTAVERVSSFTFDSTLKIRSSYDNLKIERTIFPSRNCRACIETLTLENKEKEPIVVTVINNDKGHFTKAMHGHNRERYKLYATIDKQKVTLKPNAKIQINIAYIGKRLDEVVNVDFNIETSARANFVKDIDRRLVVETSNKNLDVMERYSKIRAAESIFMTKNGLMHSPGGGNFYAALWTNDQCEYVNPLFAYLGYDKGIMSAINCYEQYKKYISADKPLITSIVAEGDAIWHGAKDRGDSAMYAYGASRFLLELGSKEVAEKFLAEIETCLAYTMSQKNTDGVIASDSDELEERFESGKANLCTSCIAYDALVSAVYLEKEFGRNEQAELYQTYAKELKENIEKYFGSSVEGYETYRYCAEETNLRSWIAMPLTVGIFDRAEQTKNALLSSKLRLNEGLLTRSGEKIFWDRSTLYTLRGLFNAGFADESYELLEQYTKSRLLGEHIPYAVEAFPEGNQAQLSAESGLYVRIFVEGLLGFRPTGFGKFTLNPILPKKLEFLNIKNMLLCGKLVSFFVTKHKDGYKINMQCEKNSREIKSGEVIEI